MKMTNIQLAESRIGLTELGKIPMPLRRSYEFSKFLRGINDALRAYGEKRSEILIRHARRDAAGKIVSMTEDKTDIEDIVAFNAEMRVLDQQIIDVDVMKISLSDLGDVNFSPTGLMSIDWLISGDS